MRVVCKMGGFGRIGSGTSTSTATDGATVGDLDGLRERVVSLPNHLAGWFGGVGRFDRLSDR